jgi:hypothetical protein
MVFLRLFFAVVVTVLGLTWLTCSDGVILLDKIRVAHNFKAFEDARPMFFGLRHLFVFLNYDCSRSYASRKKCDKSFDIATLSHPHIYETYKHWTDHSKKPVSIAFPEEPKSLLLFDNKFVWKLWMQRIGLEKYLPRTLDIHNMTFPSVMKVIGTQHGTEVPFGSGGSGVYVLRSADHYQQYSDHLRFMGSSFFVEEAVVSAGNELREGVMMGSFYKNKLLALRCIELQFAFKAFADKQPLVQDDNVFIFHGSQTERGNATTRRVSCGADVVKAVDTMMREARYSGVFCIDFKRDRRGQVKFLEVNPRFCLSLALYGSLFTAVYLPLAFALEETRVQVLRDEFEESDAVKTWFTNSTLHDLVSDERNVVLSGVEPGHNKLLLT